MRIPTSFKNKIKQVFYDKDDVKVLIKESTQNDIGEVVHTFSVSHLIECNVQPSNGNIMMKEFGLKLDATLRISTEDRSITKDNVIAIGEVNYEIVAIQYFDSHTIVMVKESEQANE